MQNTGSGASYKLPGGNAVPDTSWAGRFEHRDICLHVAPRLGQCFESQLHSLQVPLIDLEPWYSYVLKTERPEVVEGAVSSTPARGSTTYEPEQKVTVSLLIEISKEIMSLYGKAKKGAASFFPPILLLVTVS